MRKILSVVLIFSLAACSQPATPFPVTPAPTVNAQPAATLPVKAPAPRNTQPPTPLPASPAAPTNPALPGASHVYEQGSTQKVCQLLADVDWETGQPTAAKTFANGGLLAADLGYPVEEQNKLVLLFGDSRPAPHPQNETTAQGEISPDDSVGVTVRTAPPDSTNCLNLQINHTSSSKFIPATITGPTKVNQGFFNVPSGGVSVNGLLYAFFWTDHCVRHNTVDPSALSPLARPPVNPANDCPETDARNSLGKSVLAQSSDDGRSFSNVVAMPTGFVYATALNTLLQADIPVDQRLGVFIFGVPRYRASIPYIAYAAPGSLADPASWHFFSGLDAAGQPKWVTASAWNQNSTPETGWSPPGAPEIFSAASNADRCIGEFSITWNSALGKWLLLYNCSGKIDARIASAPWGPWSTPTTILSIGADIECQLVMTPDGCGKQTDYWPQSHKNGKYEPGALYAPYVLNRYTTLESNANGNKRASIYWLVSTWNPYVVSVMHTTLEITLTAGP